MKPVIYIIGSLKNPQIPHIAAYFRTLGFEAFDDWWSAGPEADDHWQAHEKFKGTTYQDAIRGYHAETVFNFDKTHLDRADIGVLVLPAGKSGHLELGYLIGAGKRGYILLNGEPDRYDVMYRFADGVVYSKEELGETLVKTHLG